ncbi:hypothetical protein ALC56_12064 [Trachymyrmex septentrionalis]|uniref:Uncharacterized protein n=2 Tax=Trachymyrmex septentrionalis TaxID=34720 RepID=A0A195EYQ4_9HYME|nr:hypothetical protein ALC56_12064 [Trachymyrmex septentrionalis]
MAYAYSRQIRQAPTTLTTVPAAPMAPVVPITNYNNTQSPYSYPTYPVYPSNVNQIGQPAAPVMNVPETTISPPTNSTSVLDTSANQSFLQQMKTYSIYILQILMTVFLGGTLINYICLQWSFCDNVFGENNFWKTNKATSRSYATSNYVDDISLAVFKAIDYYTKQQN